MTDFDFAISLEPENAMLYLHRGNVFSSLNRYDKALRDFEKAIELESNDYSLYYSAGTACYLQGNKLLGAPIINNNTNVTDKEIDRMADIYYEKALYYYSEAIKRSSDLYSLYADRGDAYLKLYQTSNAIKDFKEVIRLMPASNTGYHGLGVAYSFDKEWEKALLYLSKSISINSDYIESYIFRCGVYLENNDIESARKDFDIVNKIDPNDNRVLGIKKAYFIS